MNLPSFPSKPGLNWARKALESEIEYSRALKSQPVEYQHFIHMYNAFVPWGGDFNRAVGVQLTDFRSFEEITGQVERIHQEKNLDKPDRYDIFAPVLDGSVWQDYLSAKGYRLGKAVFFCAPALYEDLPSGFSLKIPLEQEYVAWYRRLIQSSDYYDEGWFQLLLPLQLHFIHTFKPYWLLREKDLVGWAYCANLGAYARLFAVEIEQDLRGQGLGILLLHAIRTECAKTGAQFVLLQTGEGLRNFYEKAGFSECASNSIIRLSGV